MTTNTGPAVAKNEQANPLLLVRRDIDRMAPEFAAALPQHIPLDRFKRVALTAINKNPDLLKAEPRALMGAFTLAAQDGLLPDGREGAIVMFGATPQWMPMVYGIIKKMRNSGELASISAHAVYQKDRFKYVLGDDERIEHEPTLSEDRGPMVAVYATAKLKDGTVQREVMLRADVEKVRSASRTKNGGPWKDWYEEMARKTVVRRLAKYLPMSTEVEQVLRRDDALYAIGNGSSALPTGERPRTAAGQLSAFAAAPALELAAGTAPETFVPPPQTYQLVTLDGEVSETTSAADWLARFEAALQGAADPAKLWELNSDAAEWAADMTEGGDDALARLRKTYLTRPENGEPEGDADAPAGDEWADELAELQGIGMSCQTFGQWGAFVADYAARIDALTASGGAQAEAWKAFAQERVSSFQQKKGAK